MDVRQKRRPGASFQLNPLVFAGLASFLIGSVWLLLTLGLPGGSSTPALDRTLQSAIRLAQSGILWGDLQLDDAQIRFNALVVGVFLDALSPEQRQTLSELSRATGAILGDVFSGSGLLTVVVMVVSYFGIRRAIDLHYPDLLDD